MSAENSVFHYFWRLRLSVFQVRIHGRGGQGVVTAAELLSVAVFQDGLHAQAFPSFGSERTGAPVVAYCRISEKQIRLREPVLQPDAIIIQDPTLLHSVDVFAGSDPSGYLLINTTKSFAELGLGEYVEGRSAARNLIVPASEIALKHVGRAMPNAALLGGFAAATGLVKLESVTSAIADRFPAKIAAGNIAAATEAYEFVMLELEELKHA
jgi:pyruvate ferredoxin oxidoreductase gamma subunit